MVIRQSRSNDRRWTSVHYKRFSELGRCFPPVGRPGQDDFARGLAVDRPVVDAGWQGAVIAESLGRIDEPAPGSDDH